MKHPAAMERGHLYKAEQPSSYHKGQTGKGVNIEGKVIAKSGSPVPTADNRYLGKLRKEWSHAEKASGRFPPF